MAVVVVPKAAFDCHGLDNLLKHVENLRTLRGARRRVDQPVCRRRSAQARSDPAAAALTQVSKRSCATSAKEAARAASSWRKPWCVSAARPQGELQFLYPLDLPLTEKVATIAQRLYGAARVEWTSDARRDIRQIETLGYGNLPVCMAKTPLSLTDNPKITGCPRDFSITVTNAKVSAGAGFVVVYTGQIMTMPGLPKDPAALQIDIDEQGNITGLF